MSLSVLSTIKIVFDILTSGEGFAGHRGCVMCLIREGVL